VENPTLILPVAIPDESFEVPKNTSFISISSQHIACFGCDTESEIISSLTFTISNNEGITQFILPPASKIELDQLAVLFGISHSLPYAVSFSTLPGFEISLSANSTDTVSVNFLADRQLLHFMGLDQSCSSMSTSVLKSELPALEQAIRLSSLSCNSN
jgi:hypothetical protein